MTNQARAEAVAKAEDLNNLLDHIAWQQAVKPVILKKRNDLSTMLVNATLGAASSQNQPYTKEQLAGAIWGIDEMLHIFEKILRDGEKALNELREQGFTLQQQQK